MEIVLSNRKITCSIGVIVYNEAANICKLLDALLNQSLNQVEIAEIIVVSSACTDGTDDLVIEYTKSHSHISLICQPNREGKSSAINIFIANAKSDILIIESGDTIPAHDTIEKLAVPFIDNKIGATGGRPVPINDAGTLVGYGVHLLWRLHHHMALISPKLGEMIAFRRVFASIPADSAVDEASIEALVKQQRLRLKYVPDAIITNKGPENWRDFIKQRRRIQNGHLWLKQKQNYKVVSQDSSVLIRLLINEIIENPLELHKLITVMVIEVYSRILGSIDYYFHKKNPFKWDIATSTKSLK